MSVQPLPSSIDCDRLTDALRNGGALDAGRVSAVSVESSRHTILSQIIRLQLTYEGAGADAPRSLIYKSGHPDRVEAGWNGGRHEVAFYKLVASATSGRLAPRCFEAHADEVTKDWRLLLQDLTDSHFVATVWPLPPTMAQCETILRARAQFHAQWWDDPRLGVSIGEWSEAREQGGDLQDLAQPLQRFADRLGDNLSRERRDLYERLIDAAPRLLGRFRTHRNLTIAQGDSHFWNCFLPRDGGEDVRFFDWDSWRINTGTADLAYAMAIHWYPDRRRAFERPLLEAYHSTLTASGVQGYDRRALEDDYRLSVL
jgi:hypothetical protein